MKNGRKSAIIDEKLRSTSFGNQKVFFFLLRKLIYFNIVLVYSTKNSKNIFKSMHIINSIILKQYKKKLRIVKRLKKELGSFLKREYKNGNNKRKE